MAKIIIKKRKNGTRRVQLTLNKGSKVEQSHKEEVNINTIMAKARRTGQIPVRKGTPLYGDFTESMEYHTAQNRIANAQSAFLNLPSEMRELFKNDPALLIDFVNDPENATQAAEMGLIELPSQDTSEGSIEKPEAPEGAPVEPVVVDESTDTSD